MDRGKMTVDDFHALLTLLRLTSKSAGVSEFQEEFWTGAKSLEAERKSRVTLAEGKEEKEDKKGLEQAN